MFDFFSSFGSYLFNLGNLFVSLISDVVLSLQFLFQSLSYIQSILFIVPGGLLIFGIIYLSIYVVNRVSLGNNGG